MNCIAKENDVRDTVYDFFKFCDFIDSEKPFATAKGDLSTKACYEVNKLLRYSQADAKTTDRMYQYTSVSLWFAIAKEAGFIACTEAKGGKSIYAVTNKYSDFKKMNIFSQYLLIFYTWFCFVDAEGQYNERGFAAIMSHLIDGVFAQLAENGSQKWIKYNENEAHVYGSESKPVQTMMRLHYKTVHNLRDFGLIVFEEGNKRADYFNTPIIIKLMPTDFGTAIFEACKQRKYTWFNVHADKAYIGFYNDKDADDEAEMELYKKTAEAFEAGTESFVTPFLNCFPQGLIDIAGIRLIMFEYDKPGNDNRVLEFKVSLGKKCYRVIRCLPKHTFEDLHLAIQEAFEFDDDHLYSFFLDGKNYSNYSVNSPYSENPPFSNEVCLGNYRLINKQRMLYLFDYGDEWEFDIVLDVKYETGVILKNPEIIKSVGKAPEQYPDYDDCDED